MDISRDFQVLKVTLSELPPSESSGVRGVSISRGLQVVIGDAGPLDILVHIQYRVLSRQKIDHGASRICPEITRWSSYLLWTDF